MEKYIYKITNKINGKCYIGQTTDYKRRFAEHKALGYGKEEEKTLYKAFQKYGIENFEFEVIENKTPNYNEREIYWINYYNSFKNGYNETEGGDEPPLHIKENSPFYSHSEININDIYEDILNSELTFEEIANKYDYSRSSIERINSGKLWYDVRLTYPLRKENTLKYQKEKALAIISDLKNTNLSQYALAKKYHCSRSTITMINIGANHHQDNENYPIRKK